MPRRIILISYLVLQLDSVFAESTAWNCDKSANNNQWGCTGSSTRTAKVSSPKSEESVEKIFVDTLAAPKPVASPTPAKTAPTPAAPQRIVSKSTPTLPNAQACIENASSQTQHCNTPPERKDQPKAIEQEDSSGFRLLDPAFDRNQEHLFSQLHARLKADPWAGCANFSKAENPYNKILRNQALRGTAPIQVDSNYSEVFDKVVTSFSGNVKIDRADQNVLANKVNYNSQSETMDAQGNVFYRDDEISLFSDSALLNLNTDEARLRDSLFISPRAGTRGSAKVVYQENKNFSHYKDVAYTSCPPGNQDWVIHASRFKMNKISGKAAATNAWMEFKGVPVMYTPYISFPIDDRRKSGFLAPTWSNTGQSGLSFMMPFYWDIAPNYDLLFRPRYLAKRGLMLGGDLRYMNTISNNKYSLEILPEDPLYNNATRFLTSFQNQTFLTPHMNANIDLNYVSDKKYFSDLGNALSFTNIRSIRSGADLNYNREGVDFLTRIENYQTIDQSITPNLQPYRKLPQVMLNLNHSFEGMPLMTALENEFTLFQHNTKVDGERFNIKPVISAPMRSESGFISPKASLLHTDYLLNRQYAGASSNISRNLPILSVDTGLFAEGNLNLFGSTITHTLEPRLFYLYVPKSNQNEQPVFDTAIYDTTFDNLFRENRFTGVDRVQNANQVSVALTSRFLDTNTGQERFKVNLGDIIYFQDRQAQYLLTPDNPGGLQTTKAETNRFSNIITEVSGQLTDQISFSSGLLWDPYADTLNRKQIDLHYQNQSGYIFNVGYLQRKNFNLSLINPLINENTDQIRQGDVSFRVPLIDNWSAVGRWQYSFLYNKTAESFFGLEKESCCWRFRIIGRHYINGLNLASNGSITNVNTTSAAIGTSQTTVMFQIELKNLSAFGDEIDNFLKQNIYGYSRL